MCGIVGILNKDGRPVSAGRLRRMTDIMAHRGPDDHGTFIDGAAGLGHRRLSILDLSRAGRQPMQGEHLTITFNGEIYNFKDLRLELESLGHAFNSNTDTEVLLRALEQWGKDAIPRLNGMFAFAAYDPSNGSLLLARDRFGVKPLYYLDAPGQFIFASEIKAILQHPAVRTELDPRALKEYLTFQNIYSDRTLFCGIRILPPGCLMTVDEGGASINRYWDFIPTENGERLSRRDAAVRVRECFERAVRRQLVSDVPVGCYLSGGMDSGSITSVASSQIRTLSTFTCGFDMSAVRGFESFFDERAPAELMSSAFKTEHYELVLRAGDMFRVMPDLVWHLEDLRIGMCWHNYYAARLASGFVKVVLGGAGGDELFAGYPWRYARGLQARGRDDFENIYFDAMKRFNPLDTENDILSTEFTNETRDYSAFDVFRNVLAPISQLQNGTPSDRLQSMLYFEAKTFLHGLMVVDDKLSMTHSLENRVPFLDNELVDLSLSLPSDYKLDIKNLMRICNTPNDCPPNIVVSADGKVALRRAMRGLIPDEILARKKQGFTPPETSWYRGPGLADIRELLLDPESLARPYLKPGVVERALREHASGRVNHRLLIWSLLCLEWWHRIFIDGRAVPPPS